MITSDLLQTQIVRFLKKDRGLLVGAFCLNQACCRSYLRLSITCVANVQFSNIFCRVTIIIVCLDSYSFGGGGGKLNINYNRIEDFS